MKAKFQKLVNLTLEEKEGLESIQDEIKEKGGNISTMRLIEDSILIFVKYYREQAVEKYSPIYNKKDVI